MKKSKIKRFDSVLFHLYNISEMAKLSRWGTYQWLLGVWEGEWGRCDYKYIAEGSFFVVKKQSHILKVVVVIQYNARDKMP